MSRREAPDRRVAANAAPSATYWLAGPATPAFRRCRMRRKAAGQPFMALARVNAPDLEWTRGAPAVFRSSNDAARGFCAPCGTPLAYRMIDSASVGLAVGSLDDPETARAELQYGMDGRLSWTAERAARPASRRRNGCAKKGPPALASRQHADRDTA